MWLKQSQWHTLGRLVIAGFADLQNVSVGDVSDLLMSIKTAHWSGNDLPIRSRLLDDAEAMAEMIAVARRYEGYYRPMADGFYTATGLRDSVLAFRKSREGNAKEAAE